MKAHHMYVADHRRAAMRDFASKVTALSADELAVWRRPMRPAPSGGDRGQERWEGEGGSLRTPPRERKTKL